MSVLDTLHQLKGLRRSGSGWVALCPAHDDSRHSLSVAEGEGGRSLLFCHAGCTYEAIRSALGMGSGNAKPEKRIVATYDYRDEQNLLLYQSVRFEPKGFSQRRPGSAGEWVYKLNGVRRVPYRLPDLLTADPSQTVFIVEGEKDADRLADLGLLATTNAGGAGKWRDEFRSGLINSRATLSAWRDEKS
jgi:putative DNA primase/helicase